MSEVLKFDWLCALVMARVPADMADEIRVSHVRELVRITLDELGIGARTDSTLMSKAQRSYAICTCRQAWTSKKPRPPCPVHQPEEFATWKATR